MSTILSYLDVDLSISPEDIVALIVAAISGACPVAVGVGTVVMDRFNSRQRIGQ